MTVYSLGSCQRKDCRKLSIPDRIWKFRKRISLNAPCCVLVYKLRNGLSPCYWIDYCQMEIGG